LGGVLEELFNVRTNGNGYIVSGWDHVLLKRALEQLMAEGSIQEMPTPMSDQRRWPGEPERKRFRDLETGETYEYSGPWERGGPRFKKLTPGDSGEITPKPRLGNV